jgi:hypothetical protein
MRFNLTALFDDDTRAQIKAAVLAEARNIARSVIDDTIKAEIERLGKALQQRFTAQDWRAQSELKKAVKEVIVGHWDGIRGEIAKAAQDAVDAEVAKKMKDKTVFEAEKQDAYVRKVVKSELRSMLK